MEQPNTNSELTFEQLPKAMSMVLEKLSAIEGLLQGRLNGEGNDDEKPQTVKKTAEFLSISEAKVKNLIRNGELAAIRQGKSWYITRSMCNDYLNKSRKSTWDEARESVTDYLTRQLRKGKVYR